MGSIPRITRARRRDLIRTGRKSGDPATALRFHAVAELGAGHRKSEVARRLSMAISTVVGAARRFLEKGDAGLLDQRANNGRAKVDEGFLLELWNVLEGTPEDHGWTRPTWTRELLCKEMVRRGFPEVAICTMGRALWAIGARVGSPKPVVTCPWRSERRKRRIRTIKRLAASSSRQQPVYYADEVDIHLNPHIGRDWMLPGRQRFVATPGENRKHYIAGALHAKSGSLVWVEDPSKNSNLFCKLLRRLATLHRGAKCVHLILDNYVIHKSRVTQRTLQALGGRVKLHFLPPYCPDHNRIERVWQDLHANVTRNHRCRNMGELGTKVAAFLNSYRKRSSRNPALQPRRAA